jgi:uncharacterized repeat protein (TIGR03803 family)
MVFDESGNLYGSTDDGGSAGGGVVFKLSPASGKWTYTVLHAFTNTPDGAEPNGLVASAKGTFFGTTRSGGASAMGTVFEVKP